MKPSLWRASSFTALLLAAVLLASGIACTHVPGEQELQAMARARTYLVKDSALNDQFRITARGLELLDTNRAVPDRAPEAVIHWEEVPLFQRMIVSLPIDSLLQLYQHKGERRWHHHDFKHLPEAPAPFHYDSLKQQPLRGLRVALDPGHVGGNMDYAQFWEEKYVRIQPDSANGLTEEVAFCEGNLALGTALVLAERLRSQGAEVMLTRTVEGLNAFGLTYAQWLEREVVRHEAWLRQQGRPVQRTTAEEWPLRCAGANYVRDFHLTGKDAEFWQNKASAAQVHRIAFLKAEFVERARLINDFKPHLTFIIHYNVGANNPAASNGYRKALPTNYCMAFIAGGYMAGELKEPGDRLSFAAKLLSEDLPRSQALSDAVVKAHVRKLGVPAMEWDDNLWYLKNASLRTPAVGVFSRNLQLTRLIHGTLCFGESLYQDNIDEARRLNARDFTLPGMTTPVPNRIREVADAYYEGMIDYLKQQH